jgi:hypothetical protein
MDFERDSSLTKARELWSSIRRRTSGHFVEDDVAEGLHSRTRHFSS